MQNILITGGAGFIGANLAAKLTELGYRVVCVDNFTLGSRDNVSRLLGNENFELCELDATNKEELEKLMAIQKTDMVFHLAANSDIQKSGKTPKIDLDNTFLTTASVLEAMRANNIKQIFFASTSAVYGEKPGIRLKEDTGGLQPISYYGGAKLASEAMISAYAYMNDMKATIFRFANVIGPGLTHGVIFDFIRKLRENPKRLEILGDGTQKKPYIHVADLLNAMLQVTGESADGVEIYNVGVDSDTTVTEIADIVCENMGLKGVEYQYTGGSRGWKGDVPSFSYNLDKIHAKGWRADHTSNEAVRDTVAAVLNGGGL
ncbi:MAG: NAD-dependent epimerase/dehydratase family protein [Clostridium sp.]|nr:NAD-dependent epimerase/dehydratase family protein [Roseburia sp.]MCM1432129.1 NAD-dependent epimerase/dehydratase family protein [Muribaculaceae bacterium]MCM1499511.1 NAD-dependent epimerase/dehydratase family protein [Clostridium sp.]